MNAAHQTEETRNGAPLLGNGGRKTVKGAFPHCGGWCCSVLMVYDCAVTAHR